MLLAAAAFLVAAPAAAKPRAKKKKSPFPDVPVQSREERAAGLWQAGTFAASQGDYDLAVQQFEGCLKADPKSADCKTALADAKDRVKLNPAAHKKRKHPRKRKPAAASAAAAGGADTGKAAAEAPAAPAANAEAPK